MSRQEEYELDAAEHDAIIDKLQAIATLLDDIAESWNIMREAAILGKE